MRLIFAVLTIAIIKLTYCGNISLAFNTTWCKMGKTLTQLEQISNDNGLEDFL